MSLPADSPASAPTTVEEVLAELGEVADAAYPVATPVDPRYPVYTRNNVREIFPDVATPSTWSSIGGGLERAYARAHAELRLVPDHVPGEWRYLGIFCGWASLCYSSQSQASRRSFAAPWWPWQTKAAARHGVDAAGYSPPEDLQMWARDLVWRLRSTLPVRRAERELPERVDRLSAELDEVMQDAQSRDVDAMSLPELLEVLRGQSAGARILEAHLQVTFFAGSYYALLERRLRSWTELPAGPTAAGLLVGLGALESTKPAVALVELANLVRLAPRMAQLLSKGELVAFAEAVTEPADPAEQAVAEARSRFLRDYGHRSIGEAEMRSKTWAEDPAQVDRVVGTHLHAQPTGEEGVPEERRTALQEQVLTSVAPWRRRRLETTIERARRFSAMRERTKSLTVRNGSKNKRLIRAVGRRFLDEGLVDEPDELTMLTRDELLGALEREPDDLRALIRRRQRAYELCGLLELPEETFTAPPSPRLRVGVEPPDGGVDRHGAQGELTGMGVSPGTSEGRARVVLDPRGDITIEPGEVLVAPYTDAAWAPLFMAAAAVVVDTGGMISHGAIVARDLGLPAVVNVPGTQRIRTGDRLMVDGSAGTVRIFAEGS
jgi:rifampicin phosphotransferase